MAIRIQCLCIDSADPSRIARFWAAALGWRCTFEDEDQVCLEPAAGSAEDGIAPDLVFLKVPEGKTVKNRLHLDLRPADQAAEVARLTALGARPVSVGQGHVDWVVLADPDGNEFDVLPPLTPGELPPGHDALGRRVASGLSWPGSGTLGGVAGPGKGGTAVVEQFRLSDLAADVHGAAERLRTCGAVSGLLLPGDVPGFIVSRHAELRDFLNDPAVAKGPEHFAALRQGEIPPDWPLIGFAVTPGMVTSDGAALRRLRGLVSREFGPRRIGALRPRVEQLTGQLLDDLDRAAQAAPDGVVDLNRRFAMPLPMTVICDLLGVDERHRPRIHHLSSVITDAATDSTGAGAAYQELRAIFTAVAADRRRAPGDDLTSALIAVQDEDGERLSEPELIGVLLTLVAAGHVTTVKLIVNATRALGQHPAQLALLREGAVGWDTLVEETLRYDSPVATFAFRYPTQDLTVDGTTIPAGAPVLAGYAAAGRDPRAYGPTAGQFDLARGPVKHLSFGHGPHFCLGAPLARLEGAVALEQLFTRFPGLSLAGPDTPTRDTAQPLPVRITPAGPPGR